LPVAINHLAVKIAVPVAISAFAIGSLAGEALAWSLAESLGAGLVAYGAGHFWLHARLRHAQQALQHIRSHDFDDLASPPAPPTDEISLLLRDIHRTGQTLETEIRELRERENYRREFIGNVSHELKTPIFSVQGFTETLLDGALNDESVNRTFLEKILHNANRLDNLARDLSAKIETGEMEMSNDPFSLHDLFDNALDSLEMKADRNDVRLVEAAPDNLPEVYGDQDRLRRVVVNLADNAIKYNETGGTVRLEAANHADGVVVRVVDDGIGVPPEHRSRLTERFYRVDKSRSRNQGGTGLGLAIVKHILNAHDRSLRIESTPGEGSTFSFTLPTAPAPSLSSS
jgi:two-component system phosphate regulon sensor histidine kinase PhoR